MTDDHIHDIDDTLDPLEEQDRAAELHYSNARGSEEASKGGRMSPVPMGAAAGAPGQGMHGMPASGATAASTAGGGTVLGASGVVAAGAEDEQTSGALAAVRLQLDDLWGVHGDADDVPGADLGDAPGEEWAAGGMAVRGSATRGGRKRQAAPGSMGPMGPMGGAGAGGAAAGGATGAATGGAAGSAVGTATANVPGATVGGIGSGSALAAQQSGAYGAVLHGVQQGSLPMQSMASLAGVRATGAMFSPPSTGVMAAGGSLHTGETDLGNALHRLGIDSSEPYITGPDGNIHANPFHGVDPVRGPAGAVVGNGGAVGADITGMDAARWQAAGDGIADSGGTTAVSSGGGTAALHRSFDGGTGGVRGSVGEDDGFDGGVSGFDGGVSGFESGLDAPSGGNEGSVQRLIDLWENVRGAIDRLNDDRYEHPQGAGSTTSTTPGANTSSVQQSIETLNSDEYRSASSTPQSASGVSGVSGASGVGTSQYLTARTDAVQQMSGHGTAAGSDYSVRGSELEAEARTWDEVSRAQASLSREIAGLLGGHAIFGVLEPMMAPYDRVTGISETVTRQRSERSDYTSMSMRDSAASYDQHEQDSANLLQGMND